MTIIKLTRKIQSLHLCLSVRKAPAWWQAVAGVSLLLASQTAAAEIYGSASLGWSYPDTLAIPDTQARLDYDFGLPAASLALGLERARWRFEIEASYQENEPEILYLRGSDLAFDSRESDQLTATSILLNAYRTFRVGAGFRPYLGAGLGPSYVDLLFRDDATGEPIIDDAAWTVALQASAGVEIPVTRKLALGIDYRYWYAPDFSLTDTAGEKYDLSQGIHSGWLRARYRFGEGGDPIASHPAPDRRGLFLTATAGGGWAVDEDLIGTDTQLDAYSIGPMASLSIGYALRPRWHLALELARRNNDMQIIDYGDPIGEFRTNGDVRADSLTLNLNYRFRPGLAVTPYAGIGAGTHRTRYDVRNATDGAELIGDTATGFVFQWWLGFEFAIDEHWSATTDYRMWIGDESSFELSDGTGVDARHVVQTMTFGIRYAFSR
jgi:opacity protein-like surface antigen